MKSFLRNFLPIIVVGIGIAVLVMFVKTRPEAARSRPTPLPPLVEVLEARPTSAHATITGQGTVVPARRVVLQPEVGGRVVWVSPELVPGGRFAKGDVIAKIDRRNYEAALAQAEANASRAELDLELERGRRRVAEREFKLVGSKGSDSGRSLALREPQLAAAEASVQAAKAAVEKARQDLERTTLRAPFAAIVLERAAELGQVASPQSPLVTLAGTDTYWVQLPVPSARLPFLEAGPRGSTATVRQLLGARAAERSGRVLRVLGDLDPVGRMARVIVEIERPLGDEGEALPVLLNAFVEVTIEGRELPEVYDLPETALREGKEVWTVGAEDRLVVRPVRIAWRSRDRVLIDEGLEPGTRVVIGAVSAPVPGMKLRTAATKPAGAPPGGPS